MITREEAKVIASEHARDEGMREFRRLKAEGSFTWTEFKRLMNQARIDGLCKYRELIRPLEKQESDNL